MPIGNLISQHMANFYLGYLDHFVKETLQVKAYLRYMDDMLFFADNKACLKEMFVKLNRFISEQLCLTLRENRQLNRCNRVSPIWASGCFLPRYGCLPAVENESWKSCVIMNTICRRECGMKQPSAVIWNLCLFCGNW